MNEFKTKNYFKFSLILIPTLFLIGCICFWLYQNTYGVKRELTVEIESITLPASYKVIKKESGWGGIDADAGITYTYKVGGTREEVYQQVVRSLGLNQAEHAESYDQELHGVGSPKFKYIFSLVINPYYDEFMDNDPCLANGEDNLAWQVCINKDPKRGKNRPATSMELSIIKR